jgi:hypothetical protein
MKTKISKKLGRRGKIGLAVLIAFMFIGVASAGILSHYNTITTTASISQSILVDGKDVNTPITDSFATTGGCTVCKPHWIKNNACIDGTVSLSTVITSPQGPAGVIVTYMDSVHLENKDPSTWAILGNDNMEADVTFGLVGEKFAYTLEATGLQPSVKYVLIYYADQQNRFVNWGGNNPGALLGTFTADSTGAISYSYSLDIGMDMPHADDWNNAPPADYVAKDGYNHKTGAKIWLVPLTSYDTATKKLIGWNPTTYLFETELIRYFDNTNNEITIPSGEYIDFKICHDFDIAITPGTYTITTTVLPEP